MSLPALIEALRDPRRYPHAAGEVVLVETHISWLLLAGDYAYKIKKPLTLSFLDYGTLERRRACCEAELRLNRRYAAELYLDVVAITGSVAAPVLGGDGAVVEYAVKMRRFDETRRLDHVCDRGELTPEHMRLLAREIAEFHRHAAAAAPDTRFGLPERALLPPLANFAELRHRLPATPDQQRLAALEEWTLAEFARCEPALAHRKLAGCIRECHGDLHLGNLVLGDARIVPFDCIEFNDDFRWIDVASELAFTLVDLLDHRQPALAAALLDEWLAVTGDVDALRVLRFYDVYRALVRAKVTAIRAGQEEAAAADRDLGAVLGYLALAETLAAAPRPTLTITHGVSGAGKSQAARARLLADPRCATVRLRSDVERKRLFGLDALAASGSALDAGIYTPEAHAATYRRLEELAALALRAGWSVIIDAAFLRRAERDAFRHLAASEGVGFSILACTAPVEELRRRVAARTGDASEATLAVLEKQLAWVEPLAAEEAEFCSPPVA